MSFEICSSLHHDSFLSLELASHSYHFTPIMELEGASASSDAFHPTVLLFADQRPPQDPIQQKLKSIELLYGSRVYQSFEVKQNTDPSSSLQVKDFQAHYLRTEQLFPDSAHKRPNCSEIQRGRNGQEVTTSQGRSRRDSVSYFCNQLTQLKKNVNKLMAVIKDRNPQESRPSKSGCKAPRPSLRHSKQSIEAKSTKSQQIKESRQLEQLISHFESPAKRQQEGLHDVSPIQHREEFWHQSNVSECSTRSLMRRKIKNGFDASHSA